MNTSIPAAGTAGSGILSGLRVVEGSAFVAAPLAGLTLAQLGADVIRFDDVHGGPDHDRWPLAPTGRSLFWAGLNHAKRSIRIDLRRTEGQELATELITAPGPEAGIFLTNLSARGWMAYEELVKRRSDLIMLTLTGNRDGNSEVDYTVHPATGFPNITGPEADYSPVNSPLPAWDALAGAHAALGILAAERHRNRTGEGQHISLALSDIALSTVAQLGRLAHAQLGGTSPRDGNYLTGGYGKDFDTADGRRVMVVALTSRQWSSLQAATGTAQAMADLAASTGVGLDSAAGRYKLREEITAVLQPWFTRRTLGEIRTTFERAKVTWGPYQTFEQLLAEDPRASTKNPLFADVEHPGIGSYLTPRSVLDFSKVETVPAAPGPVIGQDTEEVLADTVGLSPQQIGRLYDAGIVAGPQLTEVHGA